jgi:hypothetical protein
MLLKAFPLSNDNSIINNNVSDMRISEAESRLLALTAGSSDAMLSSRYEKFA